MTNGQRAVAVPSFPKPTGRPVGQTWGTTMLAVVAVLLGLNMIAKDSSAQEPELRVEGDPRVPRVIQVDPVDTSQIVYRLWSDGVIERAVTNTAAPCSVELICGWTVVVDNTAPQPLAPVVQIGHAGTDILYRLRSNGVLEWNRTTVASCDPPWCGWQVVPE